MSRPDSAGLPKSISQDAAGVEVAIAEDGGPGRELLQADYAVGCDGAHSIVREQAGIARGGADFEQLMVLALFRSRELHDKLEALSATLDLSRHSSRS